MTTLKALREAARGADGQPLTLQATATAAGLSMSTVQKLEAGLVAAPAYGTLAALAAVYAVPVELVAAAHAATLSAVEATA